MALFCSMHALSQGVLTAGHEEPNQAVRHSCSPPVQQHPAALGPHTMAGARQPAARPASAHAGSDPLLRKWSKAEQPLLPFPPHKVIGCAAAVGCISFHD